MTCPRSHLDGAYVLGSLSSAERLAFERHLPGCQACSASVRDLAGLPGLLGKVDAESWDPPGDEESAPASLLPSLTAAAGARRRRIRLAVVAGAAAAVVIGGTAIAAEVRQPSGGDPDRQAPTAVERVMSPVAGTDLEASVALTTVPWGTRVDLTCRYDTPTAGASDDGWGAGWGSDHPVYTLVLRTTGGTERVATWHVVPNGEAMHLTAATATDAAQIASVEIRDAEGEAVLRLDR